MAALPLWPRLPRRPRTGSSRARAVGAGGGRAADIAPGGGRGARTSLQGAGGAAGLAGGRRRGAGGADLAARVLVQRPCGRGALPGVGALAGPG